MREVGPAHDFPPFKDLAGHRNLIERAAREGQHVYDERRFPDTLEESRHSSFAAFAAGEREERMTSLQPETATVVRRIRQIPRTSKSPQAIILRLCAVIRGGSPNRFAKRYISIGSYFFS